MKLTNHATQSSRKLLLNGYLDIEEKIDMASDKAIYWGGTSQYIKGDTNNFTIECNKTLTVESNNTIAFNCLNSSFSHHLDIGNGLDVIGNITCSGDLDIEDEIIMASGKKIKWIENTGPYLSATETTLTIEGRTVINTFASHTMVFDAPTANFTGNLNAASGMDVSGNLTCSGYFEVAGGIKMGNTDRIEWVNEKNYIKGTFSTITIEGETSVSVIGSTKTSFLTPLIEHSDDEPGGPEIKVKGTNTTDGWAKVSLVSKNSQQAGDSWQIKNIDKKLQFITDRTTKGTYNDVILELTGHSNPLNSSTDVQGKLTVANDATFSENILLSANKKIRWHNNDTYISGNDSTMTIDGDTNLNLFAGSEIKLDSDKLLLTKWYNGILNFEIRNTHSSGSSALTMISGNGGSAGDTWQIKCNEDDMFFYSDIATKGTVTTNIMKLTNHATQSSRKINIYGKLEVSNGLSVNFGSDASADMFYRNSSGDFARLPKGTAGQVLKMNSAETAPEWGSSSDSVTISNNVNNRVLTGDGTNANAETNMTFTGSALNVVGTISCDTSLTIDSSVLDADDILHISDITAGTAKASKALVLNSLKNLVGISTLGCARLTNTLSISTSGNSNLELIPHGSGKVVFKGGGDGTHSGRFVLNCENNLNGITIEGPPNSAGATYTLTLPNDTGDADQVLKTDGSGNLSWTEQTGGVTMNGTTSNGVLTYNSSGEATVESTLKYDGTTLTIGNQTINSSTTEFSGTSLYTVRCRTYGVEPNNDEKFGIAFIGDRASHLNPVGVNLNSTQSTSTVLRQHNTYGNNELTYQPSTTTLFSGRFSSTNVTSTNVTCSNINSGTNTNIEIDPDGSGVVIFKGNATKGSGQIKLNCEENLHGIILKGPPHSAEATYTLTLPNDAGDANQVLKTDGSGNLSWTTVTGGGGGGVTMSGSSSNGVLTYNSSNEATVESSLLYDGTSLNIGTSGVFAGGVTIYKTGYISIRNQLRFYGTSESGTSPYIGFSAPTTVSSTLNFILPGTDGTDGQLLKTDGSGNLSWTTVTGGGGGGGGGDLPTGLTYNGQGESAIFSVVGNITASKDITAFQSSDIRLKENLVTISEPNEKIKKINGYEFDWNEKHEIYKNKHDVGVVAQEIEEVLPEVVIERDDGYKAVRYEKIIALLIESNKDLLRRVEELEERIKK